ncbi:ABC transporter substrate-binding protein [Ruicaihuangia caeni]|uniref:ABC transporter substrate-binding protein n=1 Tax=Ruicaihuangia caeni TaxID=3042517 RepID=A0AAW6T724_9MICO|nr:ABC transporter substrate-binding protein [Klugiella sp. YN-L-19]MDI2099314.1 ABC transporter substrate-binding protein [Klugiella sp. YN-L-19]
MKKFAKSLAIIAAAGLTLTACSAQADSGDSGDAKGAPTELVVTSFGGDWEAAYIEAVVEPFEEEYNAEITLVTLYSADAMAQLTAQKANPQLDVVHFSGGQEVAAAADGLIESIDPADLSNLDDLYPIAAEGVERGEGPVMQVTPIGLVYRTDKIEKAPTSWDDINNPDYAQHVALTDLSNTYGLLTLLAVNQHEGGDLDDIQPGLDSLGALVDSGAAFVIKTSADMQQAFSARDVWIAPYAQDYAETLRKADLPVEFALPSEGAPASFITANVVAGRDNADLATQLVDFSLRPEVQAKFAESMYYSPVNTKAELSDETGSRVVHGEDFGKLVRYDSAVVNEKRQSWTDAWNSRIAQ